VKDILVRGDGVNPTRPGAVLPYIDSFSYARLEPRSVVKSEALRDTQEIYYILAGHGMIVTSKGQDAELYPGVAVFIPMGLPFTIQNSEEGRLEMYLVIEPVPAGFKPRADILVKDANAMPFDSIGGHWWHKVKTLFTTSDGLAQAENVLQVTLDPLTIGHPHVFPVGQLEIWSQAAGYSICWIGKEVRIQEPGMAFQVPPDGKTSHSNINSSPDTEAVFFYVFSQPKR
jgi:mannose-6-phosphate isomerase-like protein (cupin superfamily)